MISWLTDRKREKGKQWIIEEKDSLTENSRWHTEEDGREVVRTQFLSKKKLNFRIHEC